MSSNQPPRRRRIAGERRRPQSTTQPTTQGSTRPTAEPSTRSTVQRSARPTAEPTARPTAEPQERRAWRPRVPRRWGGTTPPTATDATATRTVSPARTPGTDSDRPAGWWGSRQSLVALGVALTLLVTLVVLGALGLLGNDGIGDVREAEDAQVAAESAPSVAERAAEAILAYDHRTLDQDEDAAERFMTDDFAEEYASTFDKTVKPAAGKYDAVVTAEVKGSSVIRADSDRVRVLLFVDQTTRSTAHRRPQLALNRVEFDMVERDGRWLVDAISSF